MALVSARELLEAGLHFGHNSGRWNPKMNRYIWGKRNKVHIIDVRETIRGVIDAHYFLKKTASRGGTFLFVGTKRQARDIVKREAVRCGQHYVVERWLGGTLTNYETVLRQVKRLEELEAIDASGTIETMSKKMLAVHKRKKRKLVRNLEGIRRMTTLPRGVIVVDPMREAVPVIEANKLMIPVIAMVDTDCDPDPVDIVIPANDDAIRGIELMVSKLADAIIEGRASRGGVPVEAAPGQARAGA